MRKRDYETLSLLILTHLHLSPLLTNSAFCLAALSLSLCVFFFLRHLELMVCVLSRLQLTICLGIEGRS